MEAVIPEKQQNGRAQSLSDALRKLFEQQFGVAALRVEPVQGGLGGSGRTIVRMGDDRFTAIGIANGVRKENAAFLGFSKHFRGCGLAVPEIYAEDLRRGVYLEQDLGDTTLFQYLGAHRTGDEIAPEVVEAYRKVVETLPRFQVEAGRDLNYKLCYPRPSFDRQSMAWDLNYFKYYFLRLAGIGFHEQAMERDFSRLTSFLLSAERGYFLYRDFQSRNIMLWSGQPYFLDYQGGRRGALQYDIASLLFDSKADLPPKLRGQLLDHYLDALARFTEVDRERFLHHYYGYVYIRLLQALGAYGFRGYYERKEHFLASIPYAMKNVRWLQKNVTLPVELPALMEALAAMAESAAEKDAGREEQTNEERTGEGQSQAAKVLTVLVSSFSFHRGPVADDSGNGGGFVFDARSLPNPGREERFKRLSGRDAEVIEYLERQPEARAFLDGAMVMVEASVNEYRRRGFEHLMVSFGCTGGQHRSVFLAEALAKRLSGRSGVRVVLRHREQESWVR
jgi:aminoglycoside/choline kinase family phosphotransferase